LERVAARSSAAEHTPVAEPRNPVLPPLGAPIPPGPQLLKTPRALAKERAERESAAMPPDAGKPRAVSEPGATASMKAAPVAKADKVPMPDTGPTTRPAASPPASAPSVVASGDGESKDEHPAPGPGAAPDPNAPPLFWQLPYGVRKDLPALNLTMHVYSPDPAKRFVVINGDRKSEGDTLGSDISLREIRADGVVLEVHGQRFLVPRGGG
jgi:general secretion pathway protein B